MYTGGLQGESATFWSWNLSDPVVSQGSLDLAEPLNKAIESRQRATEREVNLNEYWVHLSVR